MMMMMMMLLLSAGGDVSDDDASDVIATDADNSDVVGCIADIKSGYRMHKTNITGVHSITKSYHHKHIVLLTMI